MIEGLVETWRLHEGFSGSEKAFARALVRGGKRVLRRISRGQERCLEFREKRRLWRCQPPTREETRIPVGVAAERRVNVRRAGFRGVTRMKTPPSAAELLTMDFRLLSMCIHRR